METMCKLLSYKISNLSYDVDAKPQREHQITATYNNSISLGLSDKDETKGIVIIEIRMSDKENEIKYSVKMKGIFEFCSKELSKEQKEDILQEEAFGLLYEKLCEIISKLPELTGQTLPPLPEIEEITPFGK